MKRLVLLGAGHTHLLALNEFAAQPLPGVQMLLVSPVPALIYSGMVPGLVAGRYLRSEIEIPIEPVARAAQARVIAGRAAAIDAAAREVQLADGQRIGYDLLSINTGPLIDRTAIPGAAEHALFVRPIEQFIHLLDSVLELATRKPLQMVVVGGGPAGFELVLAFAHRLARAGVEGSRFSLVCESDGVLANYPARVRSLALRALARARITVLPERCVAISAQHVELANGARVACDVPLVSLGAVAPAWLAGSGLALDAQGFIATGPTLQSVSHAEVFAAGDVASRAGIGKGGVHAVRAGKPLALNLRRAAAGGALEPWASPPRTLNLLACGDGRAIASWGGWSAQGRWVMRWKDVIDRRFVARFPH